MDGIDSEIPWQLNAYIIDAPEAVKYFLSFILSERSVLDEFLSFDEGNNENFVDENLI